MDGWDPCPYYSKLRVAPKVFLSLYYEQIQRNQCDSIDFCARQSLWRKSPLGPRDEFEEKNILLFPQRRAEWNSNIYAYPSPGSRALVYNLATKILQAERVFPDACFTPWLRGQPNVGMKTLNLEIAAILLIKEKRERESWPFSCDVGSTWKPRVIRGKSLYPLVYKAPEIAWNWVTV